jgi:acyl dehydratase
MKYFEDLRVGEKAEIGRFTFTAEAIKRFARAYDPQPFHLDEEAAAASSFGGLCASGWHTASVWMRLMIDHRVRNADRNTPDGEPPRMGPSPGFDDMKWLKPVFAGQTITYSTEITALRESRSKPQWGIMTSRNEGYNEDGELAFSFTGHVFVERRPQAQGTS